MTVRSRLAADLALSGRKRGSKLGSKRRARGAAESSGALPRRGCALPPVRDRRPRRPSRSAATRLS